MFFRSVVVCLLVLVAATTQAAERPNVVFILCDDLGYGDIGCFGQTKIRTPHIDKLAAAGMRFTQHYSGNAVCAPSRCVLMTGKHPGHAFIRDNRQNKPGEEGQYPIPADTVTLPKLLKELGYVTGGFGKWGLGAPNTTGEPLRQGIDRYFGYNCQAVAHNFYPTHLWDNDRQIALNNPKFSAHQKFPADGDPQARNAFDPYRGQDYAPDLISAQARAFARANKDKPFFLYYPTTVPHLALQVPEESLTEYDGKFPEEVYLGSRGYLPNRTPRATYAAMITRLDNEIGKLVATIEELGLTDRTLFVFSSDNGPLYDQLGGTDTDFFESARHLRGRKGSLYEGGFRVPTFATWRGKIPAGTTSERVTGFEDWLPTILDLIGGGEKTPRDVDGLSFAATLRGQSQPPRPFLYREFPGYTGWQIARVGDWKAVRQKLNPGPKAALNPGEIELYNLATDPSEQHNVANDHPDVIAQLSKIMQEQHTKSEVFPIRALDIGK